MYTKYVALSVDFVSAQRCSGICLQHICGHYTCTCTPKVTLILSRLPKFLHMATTTNSFSDVHVYTCRRTH